MTNVSKRGRPKGLTRKTAERILQRYPNTNTKQLQHLLQQQLGKPVTPNYVRQLRHRTNKQQETNNRHFNISQLLQTDIYFLLYDYIKRKEAQNKRFVDCLLCVFNGRYTILDPYYRYDGDLTLQTRDHNERLRGCIQRLKNQETFIMKNHTHNHNNKKQVIEYHVGDHDLTKFLCNYLGIPYKARLYLAKGHFISTDSSGLDVCHHDCLKNLLDTSIQTGFEGNCLLESSYAHGKLVVGNKVKSEW